MFLSPSFTFRKSRLGFVIAGIFVFAGVAALGFHLYSVTTNPADSGLSGLYLYFLAQPWIHLIPEGVYYSRFWDYGAYPVTMLFVFVNAFLLYILCGGLKMKGKTEA